MAKDTRRVARQRRHARVRRKILGTSSRPRLNVFRSLQNIYAQVIDDEVGRTLAVASTLEPELRPKLAGLSKTEQARLVGQLIAERALAQGATEVVFDRGGYPYHGRVRALAEASREHGLKF